MRHWSQLATRNWPASRGRTATTILAVALSVGMVVWITCCYESLRRTVNDWVWNWVGRSHLSVESPLGKWGNFDDDVVRRLKSDPQIEALAQRLWWRVYADVTGDDGIRYLYELDLTGIDPPDEYTFRNLPDDVIEGRALRRDDREKLIVEAAFAKEYGLGLGDSFLLRHKPDDAPVPFEIVGLMDRTRINRFQRPTIFAMLADVQSLTERPGLVTTVDLRLKGFNLENADELRRQILDKVQLVSRDLTVKSAEQKLRQLRKAQEHLELELSALSCIAFLTALFIILSTLSMGMIQRMGQMGLQRCVGVTRWQLGILVPLEVVPLGVIGVVLGVPLGFTLMWLTTILVPEYVARMAISGRGVAFAVAGGLITAVVGAVIPMLRVMTISPLAALHSAAERHGKRSLVLAAVAGLAMVGAQFALTHGVSPERSSYHAATLGAVLCLYVGYALLAPALVLLIGGPAVRIVAAGLRLNRRLLRDQVSRMPWRGGGICAGLMVGLSLIVGLLVFAEGIVQAWSFPSRFPEAFVYVFRPYPLAKLDEIQNVPGVGRLLAVQEFSCKIDKPKSGLLRWLEPSQRFIAADVERFPDIIRLNYLEGDEESALRQLREGTGVLLTREFMRAYDKHLGDPIKIRANHTEATFTVAGVVASPSIDIAVEFFQAGGEFQLMSVGSVIGTMAQAKRYFNQESFRLLVFDFDLADEPIPPPRERLLRRQNQLPLEGELTPEQGERLTRAWQTERENRAFRKIRDLLPDGHAQYGSVSLLKDLIDREIRQITRIMTAIPALALLVAVLGVGNLMMANVNARARQIATLRAVGATKWLIVRLVVGEASVLALIGCVLGVGLGFHLAALSNYTTAQMVGFEPVWAVPWNWVGYGVAFTSGMCLLAGIAPACRAARNDIISALAAD